jgi:allophanate hydrolase subunit 2
VGQAKPGQRVRFTAVDVAEAQRLFRAAAADIANVELQEIAS